MRKYLLALFILVLIAISGAVTWWRMRPVVVSDVDARYLVSLGDSVAVGAGLPLVANPSPDDTACGRSSEAFPIVLSRKLKLPLKQFACSGAKTAGGILQEQVTIDRVVPAQLPAALPYVQDSIVVVTIGANDVGWSDQLRRCAQEDCAADVTLQASLKELTANLTSILVQVQAAHPKLVLVNEYYGLVANHDTCLSRYGIPPERIAELNGLRTKLNAAIVSAAVAQGAYPVPIDFNHHGLCDVASWIQGPLSNAPLHPSKLGVEHIAAQDLELVEAHL